MCNRCFLIEDNGLNSPRFTHNDLFRNRMEEILDMTNEKTGEASEFKLRYWDFRWSNICNFKCRMCGVYSSSKWHQEALELHGDTTALDSKGILEFNSNGIINRELVNDWINISFKINEFLHSKNKTFNELDIPKPLKNHSISIYIGNKGFEYLNNKSLEQLKEIATMSDYLDISYLLETVCAFIAEKFLKNNSIENIKELNLL